MTALYQSDINLPLFHRGKVRDIYSVDENHLLIVTSDRLSAFDVVLPQPIPGKGEVLTRVTNFWFDQISDVLPNHLGDLPLNQVIPDAEIRKTLGDRAVVVKKLKPLPIEAIVRGYIIGSGWKDYQKSGQICGIDLAENLKLADQLPEAIFTPSTKAAVGGHDENIDFDNTQDLLGEELATRVKSLSLELYQNAAKFAQQRGIIIADTKFEFGLDENNQLHIIDEVLTPDSSRFWPAAQYRPGHNPLSYDKQFLRDYLETLDWDKTPPGPELPEEIITKTAQRYAEAEQTLTQ